MSIPVFDGHNDTLTQIHNALGKDARTFLERSGRGHLDLPRAREGGMAGGFFAVFAANRGWERQILPVTGPDGARVPGAWTVPLPPRLARSTALAYTLSVMSDLFRWERAAGSAMQVVRTAGDLERCLADGTFAAVLHIEGVEALDTRLEALDVFFEAGLRSLGPVWSRPNAFGHGVPFDFPSTPDIGPGLTAAGRRLVRACNRLGVLVDLSHLNEAGFWDVARLSQAPLVATHSCAWALSPSPRNLTDRQLDAVRDSGGLVGINFHKGFLRSDGDSNAPAFLADIARHARYVADRIGVEHVALGSDFDGAVMPDDLPDVTALPKVMEALRDAGFGDGDLRRIGTGNWLRVLRTTWHG
ncbi:MAG TPA: dipeptidase [Longimicrobiales bacterium]|nr:dipeptidase [Longimicrobiales bacterium]